MLRRLPGTFVAGEIPDWEVPTAGYSHQGSFGAGVVAAPTSQPGGHREPTGGPRSAIDVRWWVRRSREAQPSQLSTSTTSDR